MTEYQQADWLRRVCNVMDLDFRALERFEDVLRWKEIHKKDPGEVSLDMLSTIPAIGERSILAFAKAMAQLGLTPHPSLGRWTARKAAPRTLCPTCGQIVRKACAG